MSDEMTPERLNEITSSASYLLNELCVWFKQEQDDRGWAVALNRDTSIYYYIVTFEYYKSNSYLACNIADDIKNMIKLDV